MGRRKPPGDSTRGQPSGDLRSKLALEAQQDLLVHAVDGCDLRSSLICPRVANRIAQEALELRRVLMTRVQSGLDHAQAAQSLRAVVLVLIASPRPVPEFLGDEMSERAFQRVVVGYG